MRARLLFALKVAVSLALVAVVLGQVDLAQVAATIGQANGGLLALAVLQLALQPFVGALRWRVIVAAMGGRMPYPATLRLTFVAIFFNQVLPGAVVGDGMRAWLAQRQGLTWRRAIHSVAADRVAMLSLLLVLALATQDWLSARLGFAMVWWLAPAAAAAAVLALVMLLLLKRLPPGWHRFGLLRWMHDLSADLRPLLFRFGPALKILATSLLACTQILATLWLLGMAVNAPVPGFAYAMVGPTLILASALPISIGGWGVREAAALSLLTAVGASGQQAVAISVLLGLASLTVALPGLAIWLLSRFGRRWGSAAAAGGTVA